MPVTSLHQTGPVHQNCTAPVVPSVCIALVCTVMYTHYNVCVHMCIHNLTQVQGDTEIRQDTHTEPQIHAQMGGR